MLSSLKAGSTQHCLLLGNVISKSGSWGPLGTSAGSALLTCVYSGSRNHHSFPMSSPVLIIWPALTNHQGKNHPDYYMYAYILTSRWFWFSKLSLRSSLFQLCSWCGTLFLHLPLDGIAPAVLSSCSAPFLRWSLWMPASSEGSVCTASFLHPDFEMHSLPHVGPNVLTSADTRWFALLSCF